jgi:ribosome biogenesis GTPase
MKLSDLGFDHWFEAQAGDFRQDGCGFARVSAVDRGAYRIKGESQEVAAELAGRLYYQTETASDLPCVGDWVTAQYHDHDTAAIIHRVSTKDVPAAQDRG